MNACFIIFCSLMFCTYLLPAQELITFSTQEHCSFSGTAWEEELYRFPANPKVASWVLEILEAGGVSQNFELIQANVENIAAVYDVKTGKRYLLFSQNHLEKAATKLEVYAAFAHEIGHHVNEHTISEASRKGEEWEADYFMGYVLAKISGISALQEAERVIELLPTSHPQAVTNQERRQAIEEGWKAAQASFAIKSATFDYDPNREALLQAQFPFPPPPCCSPITLPDYLFSSATHLGDLDKKLRAALGKTGFVYFKYMSVPNGFALVTQMEQYNANYTSRNDNKRWNATPVGANFAGYLDYFRRLLFPEKAYFRTFVFLVSTQDFNTKGKQVTKAEVGAWYGQGINRLPKTTASQIYNDDVKATVLVYEFEVPESNRRPTQKCPSINTLQHLKQSGLWQALGLR